MNRFFPSLFVLLICFTVFGQGVKLVPISSGFSSPVDLTQDPKTNKLIVVQKGGKAIAVGDVKTDFINITDRVRSSGGEQGLLGLVFHPEYPAKPYIFVNYIRSSQSTRVARFTINQTTDVADPGSEKTIFEVIQPFSNHNGGDLAFGPDGYLYIGLGDGGSGGDPENRAQNRQTLLGKMLRIDINTESEPYLIPPTNPFVSDGSTLDEIWSIGLRNPWRFSFDKETKDLYIADVGQNAWEEVNFVPASSPGAENYGWRCYEGDAQYILAQSCPSTPVNPIFDYPSGGSVGCSVTGGFVYRKTSQDPLYGSYIYGDYCSGKIWALKRNGNTWVNSNLIEVGGGQLSSFGEGLDGALYVVKYGSGEILELKSDITSAEIETLSSVSISPNPASQFINLTIPNDAGSITDVTVTDVQGRIMWKRNGKVVQQLSIPIQDYNMGIYLVSFYQNNVKKTEKVLVTK